MWKLPITGSLYCILWDLLSVKLHPLSAVFNVGLCLPCIEVRIFPFFTSDQLLSQQKHHFLAHLTTPF